MSKYTHWVELDAARVRVISEHDNGFRVTRKLAHPDMPRARFFNKSQAGNWYWRETGDSSNADAYGYIVKE